MDLIAQQRALAKLYTDAGLRARFFDDPKSVGAAIGLSPVESESLASDKRLERFAGSLIAKRRGEVARLLPTTAAALGMRFKEVFRSFAATTPLAGEPRHVTDAVEFSGHLHLQGIEVCWCDLARWEAAECLIRHTARSLVFRRFSFDVESLVRGSTSVGQIPRKRLACVVWFRVGNSGPRMLRLPLSFPFRFFPSPLEGEGKRPAGPRG